MPEIPSPSQTIGPLYGFAPMFEGAHHAVPPDARQDGDVLASTSASRPRTDTVLRILNPS